MYSYIFVFSVQYFPIMTFCFELKKRLVVKAFKWDLEHTDSFPAPAWKMLHVVPLLCLWCIFLSVRWLPQCKACQPTTWQVPNQLAWLYSHPVTCHLFVG